MISCIKVFLSCGGKNMSMTEAKARANKKYLEKFDSILVRVKPELKTQIAEFAKQNGESVNAFIVRAISEAMEKDGQF